MNTTGSSSERGPTSTLRPEDRDRGAPIVRTFRNWGTLAIAARTATGERLRIRRQRMCLYAFVGLAAFEVAACSDTSPLSPLLICESEALATLAHHEGSIDVRCDLGRDVYLLALPEGEVSDESLIKSFMLTLQSALIQVRFSCRSPRLANKSSRS